MTVLGIELAELKSRVERLEEAMRRLQGQRVAVPTTEGLLERERLLAELKAEGLIRDPLPEELALAAEWDALPEEEKQAVIWELEHLPPVPWLVTLSSRVGVSHGSILLRCWRPRFSPVGQLEIEPLFP